MKKSLKISKSPQRDKKGAVIDGVTFYSFKIVLEMNGKNGKEFITFFTASKFADCDKVEKHGQFIREILEIE